MLDAISSKGLKPFIIKKKKKRKKKPLHSSNSELKHSRIRIEQVKARLYASLMGTMKQLSSLFAKLLVHIVSNQPI